MNKNLFIKLIVFLAIIISQMLPLAKAVSKAQAAECCYVHCAKNVVDKIACPTPNKNQFCKTTTIECCKEQCLNSSKNEIALHSREFSQRISKSLFNQVLFSSSQVSLDHKPLLFYQFPQNKVQNLPIFQINSVYLI